MLSVKSIKKIKIKKNYKQYFRVFVKSFSCRHRGHLLAVAKYITKSIYKEKVLL